MRYGEPSIPNQLQKLTDQGCTQIVVMPLYPQYAASTTATVNDELFGWLLERRWQPALRTVPPWHDNPTYVTALADSVRAAVAEHGRPDALVVSFHGIPKRYHMAGDPYHCHCMKTARLLRESLDGTRTASTPPSSRASDRSRGSCPTPMNPSLRWPRTATNM